MFETLAMVMLAVGITESPIICNLNALTAVERAQHERDGATLQSMVVKIEDVEGGYRLQLSSKMPIPDLLHWIEAERRCCPFLDFEVRLDRENGARWLQLTGRQGVKEFLTAEFRLKSR